MTTQSEPPKTPKTTARRRLLARFRRLSAWWLPAGLAVAAIAIWVTLEQLDDREASIDVWLNASTAEFRKRAAWRIAGEDARGYVDELVAALPRERDDGAREAYIYALGHVGNPTHAPIIEQVLETEADGFVRQAAWLALARLAPERFIALRGQAGMVRDRWDRLGIAIARIDRGNFSALSTLLEIAEDPDISRRYIARRAIEKYVQPWMEIAGRWPLEAATQPIEQWTPATLAEIRRRAAEIAISDVVVEVAAALEHAEPMRTSLRRMTRTRDWMAGLLFGE
jgi:HEAT repeat protein